MSAAAEMALPEKNLLVRLQMGGADLVRQLEPHWRALCDESVGEVFYRPEGTLAWLSAFAHAPSLTIISVWNGHRLRALLPLSRTRIWIAGFSATCLTLPGNVHCARIGFPLCANEEGEHALSVLWQALKNLRGWHVFDVSHVLEGDGLDRLAARARHEKFPVARKRTSQTLYLSIGDSGSKDQPPWMSQTRPKFRSHLRRSRRQLEEQGTLELKHYGTADPAALSRFFDLEASGWKGAEGTAIKCDSHTLEF